MFKKKLCSFGLAIFSILPTTSQISICKAVKPDIFSKIPDNEWRDFKSEIKRREPTMNNISSWFFMTRHRLNSQPNHVKTILFNRILPYVFGIKKEMKDILESFDNITIRPDFRAGHMFALFCRILDLLILLGKVNYSNYKLQITYNNGRQIHIHQHFYPSFAPLPTNDPLGKTTENDHWFATSLRYIGEVIEQYNGRYYDTLGPEGRLVHGKRHLLSLEDMPEDEARSIESDIFEVLCTACLVELDNLIRDLKQEYPMLRNLP